MARALYRSRQVLHSFKGSLSVSQTRLVREVLSPAESELFFAMDGRDQHHALEVAGRLTEDGWQDKSLLKAALLHDCGKGRVSLWLRIIYVIAPPFVRGLASEGVAGARAEAFRLINHAEIGTALAAAAGVDSTTAGLIAGRPDAKDAHLGDALARADDAS